MALVVIGTCNNCGAQQLDNGMILVAPEQALRCQTHDFVPTAEDDQQTFEKPKIGGGGRGIGSRSTLPTKPECEANDKLSDHQAKVELKIQQTQDTIATLEGRHEHWRQVIQDDFQRVVEAAETRRDKLLSDLDDLVQHKQGLLSGQLDEYTEHFNQCQDMLDDIYRRIQLDDRNKEREESIIQDSRKTVSAFPRLDIIPIAVAAECQTQPMVERLNSFGAILESDLGRLPTVIIEEADDKRMQISYVVIDPEDAEEKQAVQFIPGLQVEVQASVFADRSLGWEVVWKNRVNCDKVKGQMRIDTKGLPRAEQVAIRARTIIINGQDPADPIRISKWSDVSVMANNMRPRPSPRQPDRPAAVVDNGGAAAGGGGDAPEPPNKNIFVVCVDPATKNKLPCRPAPPDYVAGVRNAAIRKWKWNCSPEDIKLKIVQKDSGDLVSDLSVEAFPNNVLADMWDRNSHFVHVVQEESGGEPNNNSGANPVVDPEPEPEPADIVWPKRLMVRIKEHPTRESPARPSPLKVEDRALPGGWLGALQRRYCERFNLQEEGEMQFYFVDDEGNRVKDIRQDADFLYVQENRKKVYAVGERA